ncbi:MAG: hypothetical protein M1331_01190 [Candidatus Marsarchaeota archaeon]|nr:hypothetical protein [Candidatus Marsarchaeota archaeon]MCL5105998.1 hypothetical protein [Candidatus Marsarchaeota archaeon]
MAYQKTVDKWKLKKWFSVYAPKIFENRVICEIPAGSDKNVTDRNIKIGLDTLTNNVYNSNTNVILRITDAENDSAHTKILRIELLDSYLNSIVRKAHSAIETRMKISTRDSKEITIKGIVITKQRVAHTKIKGLREEVNDFISHYCKNLDSDAVVKDIIEKKMQSQLIAKLRKIVPISKLEIKKIELN